MGRLITVDELNAKLRNTYEHEKDVINSAWLLNTLIDKVDEIPTAYDPDKVVEQLENERMFWENAYDRDLGKEKARSYEHAVEIVKGGGVDD